VTRPAASVDLQAPDFLANPYPYYASLRQESPVTWHPGLNRWLVSRFADVEACFRDPRLSSDRTAAITELRSPAMRAEVQPLTAAMKKQIAFVDPPDHSRLRNLVNHALTPRMVERLRPFVQETVDQLLDESADRGSMDLVADFAYPLSGLTIARLLGVPNEHQPRFRAWARAATTFLGDISPTEESDRNSIARMSEAVLYFFARYQDALFQPRGESLLSVLVQATEQDDSLTTDEVVLNAILLIAAGYDTVTNLISSGIVSLLNHRDQWERLRRQPELIEPAVEELMRFESPFQFVTRTVAEDMTLSGASLTAGQTVMLLLGSANRDEQAFDRPDALDIGRPGNRHLAFGRSIHFCLGAPLARLQAQVAISTLAQRLPTLRLASGEVEWLQNFEFRGVQALPVSWGAESA
jgi:cytochrome P450